MWREGGGGAGGGGEGKADDGSGGDIPLDVEIVLGAHTGMNIQCDGSNHAKCNNANTGGWERVKIKQRGSSYILTSMKSGNNLQCQADGKCAFANRNEQLWEQWAIETKGDALYFVSRHTNKVMQCAPDGRVRCANENRAGYETFRVVWREGGGGAGAGGAGGGGAGYGSISTAPVEASETVSIDTLVTELSAAATTPALQAVMDKAVEYLGAQGAAMKKAFMTVWIAVGRERKGALGDVWTAAVAAAFGASLHAAKD